MASAACATPSAPSSAAYVDHLISLTQGFSTCGPRTPGVRGELTGGPRATPERLETRRILTKQKYLPHQCCRYRLQRTELKTSLVFAMLCRLGRPYAILIRHVLAQPGLRKVEAGAPWAVGSATRAWNLCDKG